MPLDCAVLCSPHRDPVPGRTPWPHIPRHRLCSSAMLFPFLAHYSLHTSSRWSTAWPSVPGSSVLPSREFPGSLPNPACLLWPSPLGSAHCAPACPRLPVETSSFPPRLCLCWTSGLSLHLCVTLTVPWKGIQNATPISPLWTAEHEVPGLPPLGRGDKVATQAAHGLYTTSHRMSTNSSTLLVSISVSISCSVMSNSWWPYGLLWARILEWVTFPFSRESSQSRDWTQAQADTSPAEPQGKPIYLQTTSH